MLAVIILIIFLVFIAIVATIVYLKITRRSKEIERSLLRYRAGLISLEQSRQELSLLSVMLKAYETSVLEEKLDKIQAVLENR